MKILFTGGGSAGHFYPLIAIAEKINKITEEEKLLKADLYYMSTAPFDKKLLFDNDITFKKVFAGKVRLYFSLLNFVDAFKMALGILKALWSVYLLYPDVVASKGGYASVPAVFAARVLGIPVVVHESDSIPGRTNQWSSHFAERVAVSWEEAARFFPEEKTAVIGQPIRETILNPARHGPHEYLKLAEGVPVILVLGGSQGAKIINEVVIDTLPVLLSRYQIIHQTGTSHLRGVKKLVTVVLGNSPYKERYKPFGYLNDLAMRMSAGIASLVISRAGSTIFEIASWGLPSIIIPISSSNEDHQRRNAFSYARKGGCVVVEERNLTQHVLISEIDRLLGDEDLRKKMGKAARKFFKPDAASTLAREILNIALRHEK